MEIVVKFFEQVMPKHVVECGLVVILELVVRFISGVIPELVVRFFTQVIPEHVEKFVPVVK